MRDIGEGASQPIPPILGGILEKVLVNPHYIFVSLSSSFQWFEEKTFTVFRSLRKTSNFPQSYRLRRFEKDLTILSSYFLKAVFFSFIPTDLLWSTYLWIFVFLPSPYHRVSSWKVGHINCSVLFSSRCAYCKCSKWINKLLNERTVPGK